MFFFFNDTATTEIYTLSLHDALPISRGWGRGGPRAHGRGDGVLMWSLSCRHLRQRFSSRRGRGRCALHPVDQLLGQRKIALRAHGLDVIQQDRFTEARRLRQADVPWHRDIEHLRPEVFLRFLSHLLAEVEPRVEHRQQHSIDRSEEHTSELQSRLHLVCRLLLEKKKEDPGHRRARATKATV